MVYYNRWHSSWDFNVLSLQVLAFFPFGKEVEYGGGVGSFC